MLYIGLWRWYSNVTLTILDIIHRPVFYSKHKVSETGFCLLLQAELSQTQQIVSGDRIQYPKRCIVNNPGMFHNDAYLLYVMATHSKFIDSDQFN
jgi:hypothetical protein